ncbi:hypothetical protein MSG28_002318 [Choristoneura fumiferana]|uniref:Uncharacterized protein n=1 Tax=Choristoneura fumiferana TaxID=7141 RepID=A0ACC0JV03_CHOFU|nr:hypothetical protein MSG28_002318 [Choristoneura fumiferana]
MVEALQWACIHTIQVIWQLQGTMERRRKTLEARRPPRRRRAPLTRCSWLGAESGGCEINTARRRPPDESERDPAVPFTAESTTPGLPSPPPSKHPRHYRFFSYSDLVMIIQVKSSEKDFSGTFGKNLDTTL